MVLAQLTALAMANTYVGMYSREVTQGGKGRAEAARDKVRGTRGRRGTPLHGGNWKSHLLVACKQLIC